MFTSFLCPSVLFGPYTHLFSAYILYTYIYIAIYSQIYMQCKHTHTHIYIFYIHLYISLNLYRAVHMHMYSYIYIYIFVYACIYILSQIIAPPIDKSLFSRLHPRYLELRNLIPCFIISYPITIFSIG